MVETDIYSATNHKFTILTFDARSWRRGNILGFRSDEGYFMTFSIFTHLLGLEGTRTTSNISGYDIAKNIRITGQIFGTVKSFRSYYDFSALTSLRNPNLRLELQSSGISLIDCPSSGSRNVATKMMMGRLLSSSCRARNWTIPLQWTSSSTRSITHPRPHFSSLRLIGISATRLPLSDWENIVSFFSPHQALTPTSHLRRR